MEIVRTHLNKLADEGVFDGELIKIEETNGEGKAVQLMSEIKFYKLRLRKKDVVKEQEIIVKVQLNDSPRTADCRTDLQFANEVTMYSTILPQLGADGVSPKMLFGNISEGADMAQDLIILEDLRSYGYKIADDLFFDYDHVVLSLRKLGEFHGLSYKMKHDRPQKFKSLCEMLHPRKYNKVDGLAEGALFRGFAPISDIPVAKLAHQKLLDWLNSDGKRTINAEEPFAVITHGDFNRNNMLYDYKNNKVLAVKFIDYAFSYYNDPSYDISFFLYMHTSNELRRKHWDAFLNIYWSGVTSVGDPGFSFGEFLKNFAKKAIWGYCVCCFWLPMMMCPEMLAEREVLSGSDEEKRHFGMTAGGEGATKAVCDIARHILDMGYLEEFVNHEN